MYPLVQGDNKTALNPSAYTGRGSGSALQEEPRNRKERIIHVEINSNDRNQNLYPNPAEFQWTFANPLKNVTSIKVTGGTVPIPYYTIDTPSNQFIFDTGSAKKLITIPPGQYLNSNFPAVLQSLLNTADGVNTYTVTISSTTLLLTVVSSGTNTFGFCFGSNNQSNLTNQFGNPGLQKVRNVGYHLGFTDQDVYTVADRTIVSPNPVWLNPLSRIYVYLNYDTSIDLRSIVLGGAREGPSAIIYTLDADALLFFMKSPSRDTFENVINPGLIIPRIRTLNVSLQDEFKNVVNTNNRPVTFLLEITVLD